VVPALPEEPAPKQARKRTGNTNRTEEIDDVLLRRLLEHHGCPGGTVNCEPLSAAQLQRDLGWNSSKVQRAMTHVFGPKPVNAYRAKCKDRTISTFLVARAAGMVPPVACDVLA
jgi:AraC-like DNA-binding protein